MIITQGVVKSAWRRWGARLLNEQPATLNGGGVVERKGGGKSIE